MIQIVKRGYSSKYTKRTISFNFVAILISREKELSMEKYYFLREVPHDKDGIHPIGRVYSRNVMYLYIAVSYRFSTRKKAKAYVFSIIFRCKRRSQSLFQTRNDDRHVHVDVKRSNTIIRLVIAVLHGEFNACLSVTKKKKNRMFHGATRHRCLTLGNDKLNILFKIPFTVIQEMNGGGEMVNIDLFKKKKKIIIMKKDKEIPRKLERMEICHKSTPTVNHR